jgi:hypothetical protein
MAKLTSTPMAMPAIIQAMELPADPAAPASVTRPDAGSGERGFYWRYFPRSCAWKQLFQESGRRQVRRGE